jgi:hypothetical protein
MERTSDGLHAVRALRPSNEREEEHVNGKESEEAREESSEKNDDEVVGLTNLDEAPRSRRGAFFICARRGLGVAHPGKGELYERSHSDEPVSDSSWAGQISE